jgi:hypothetical protein
MAPKKKEEVKERPILGRFKSNLKASGAQRVREDGPAIDRSFES